MPFLFRFVYYDFILKGTAPNVYVIETTLNKFEHTAK